MMMMLIMKYIKNILNVQSQFISVLHHYNSVSKFANEELATLVQKLLTR